MAQLIQAVEKLHAQGIQHGNLRLDSIYVDVNGDIKIDNFSYARNFGDDFNLNMALDKYTPDFVLLKQYLIMTHDKNFYSKQYNIGINYDLLKKDWVKDITNLIELLDKYYKNNINELSPIDQIELKNRINRFKMIKNTDVVGEYISNLVYPLQGEQDIYALSSICRELCVNPGLNPPQFINAAQTIYIPKIPKIKHFAKDFATYAKQQLQLLKNNNEGKEAFNLETVGQLMQLIKDSVADSKIEPKLAKFLGENAKFVNELFAIKSPRLSQKNQEINKLLDKVKTNISGQDIEVKNALLLIMLLYKQKILYEAASKSKNWALFTNLYNAYNMRALKAEINGIKKKLYNIDEMQFDRMYKTNKKFR